MNETASELDRWTAAHCRVSRRLFAVSGAAGVTGAPPDVTLVLTSLAGQFAWHGELFFELLPVRVGIDRDALVESPAPAADAALDLLEPPAMPLHVAALLADVVLPRLEVDLSAALTSFDARLDGPRARALTLIRRDLLDALSPLAGAVDAAPPARGAAGLDTQRSAMEDGLVSAGVGRGFVRLFAIG